MTRFLDSFSSKIGESWAASVLTPAFLFWAGGLGAWSWANRTAGEPHRLLTWTKGLNQAEVLALLVLALALISATGVVVERLDSFVIRVLEGYWPPWCDPLTRRMVSAKVRRREELDRQFQDLHLEIETTNVVGRSADRRLAAVEQSLARLPALPSEMMPTRLGNTLRASEARPRERYGLDTVVCWSRMWLVVPDDVREQMEDSRASLDADVRTVSWAALFLVWSAFTWWVVPIAMAIGLLAYRASISSAEAYGDLLEAVFDLHRVRLYRVMRWPLPKSPADERKMGLALTEYLYRGSENDSPMFEPPI